MGNATVGYCGLPLKALKIQSPDQWSGCDGRATQLAEHPDHWSGL